MDDKKLWSCPVRFETGLGQYRTIADTEDAIRFMASNWPTVGGEAHESAQQICIEALEGYVPADDARDAFIEACCEARIIVMSSA
ncbi:DUF982 domain-containing protein [Labrys portucalensis]|uniref:DUF982 domain-containing protein n=1 Tax=Labrys neptuniae TaxID=376174 RepID=A0ABV6Z9I7_9HYPH